MANLTIDDLTAAAALDGTELLEAEQSGGSVKVQVSDLPGGSAVVLVAASDASDKVKAAADYTCDGTDDGDEIESAVADLPSGGGMVLLSEGTFNVDPVTITADNVTLAGRGAATIVKLQAMDESTDGDTAAIRVQGTDESDPIVGVHIRDLTIDGNDSAHTSSSSFWQLEGLDFKFGDRCQAVNVTVHDAHQDGIDLDGTVDSLILGCRLIDCGGYGVHLGGGSGDGTNRRNMVAFCLFDGNGGNYDRGGVDQNENSEQTTYIGNVAVDNYRNYNIEGSGATFIGNQSRGTTTEGDVTTGVEDDGGSGGSTDLSNDDPEALSGSADAGTSSDGARADHVHPDDGLALAVGNSDVADVPTGASADAEDNAEAINAILSALRDARIFDTLGSYGTEVTADSPDHWWRFAETSGTTLEDSAGTQDGTVANSPDLNATGPVSSAIGFDGVDQYADMGTIPALSDLMPLTIEFWIRTTTSDHVAVMGGFSNDLAFCIRLNKDENNSNAAGKTNIFLRTGGSGDYTRWSIDEAIYDGSWHHVVFAIDDLTTASGFKTYVDGAGVTQTVDRTNYSSSGSVITGDLYVGALNDGSASEHSDIDLAELAFYPAQLSATRASDHYDAATSS